MAIADAIKAVEAFTSANSAAILTGVGITGVVTTAYLTGRASFKAARLIDEQENILDENEARFMTNKEKVEVTWPLYIPAVGVGALTIGAIFMAHRVNSAQATALVAAYGVSERALQEYKAKVVERLGDKEATAIRDDIAQDRVKNKPVESAEVIIVGNGDVLCYDSHTGRYFQSTIETIKRAENAVNYEIINHSYASLASFYDEIGLPATQSSQEVGWNLDNILNVTYSATIATNGKPCIVIDFVVAPIPGYGNLY